MHVCTHIFLQNSIIYNILQFTFYLGNISWVLSQFMAIELSFSVGALYFIVWIYYMFYQSANDEQVVFLINYVTINTFM